MINLPIFRAKKIDSDEYVEGYYVKTTNLKQLMDKNEPTFINKIVDSYNLINEKIDIATLSIHFPDMLDSQGNKIFASLSEDGKGGDICEINVIDAFLEKNYNIKSPILIMKNGLKPMEYLGFANFKIIKVIGIQQ